MRFQDLVSSKPMTRLGIVLGQRAPRRVGYGLARIVAGVIARRKPEVYWTVRANLHQILGPEADDGLASHARLHRMTRQVFFHAGQTYYDFFHAIGQPKEVLAEAVRIPDEILAFARSETARGQGVLVLAAHMSNFDLLGLSMGAQGLPIQILSLADPQAGFHLLNYLRATAGFPTAEEWRHSVDRRGSPHPRGSRAGRVFWPTGLPARRAGASGTDDWCVGHHGQLLL